MNDITPSLRDAALKFLKFAATHDKTGEGPAKAMAVAATCMEREATEIERLRADLVEIERIANIAPADDSFGSLAVRMGKVWLLARGNQQGRNTEKPE